MWVEDGRLLGRLVPPPAVCTRGTVSAAALAFFVDVVAGVAIDTDTDAWAFTSELSVRAPLAPPPAAIDGCAVILRGGKRSITCEVPMVVDGAEWGGCFIGFARVPWREGDPPKIVFDPDAAGRRPPVPPLDEPLRAAAGFTSLDPSAGVVGVELRPDLLNPAGALQGAMVAGLAEAAAEDLADHHRALGTDLHVVTELEVRYLAQNRTSPIRSRARFVGSPSEGLIRVDLVDDGGRGRLTTSALARVRPAPAPASASASA
jgi:acyl-coenzyme A thioesterase PaaI-like protein